MAAHRMRARFATLALTVVKALGDASNPAHIETHTFAKANIQRAP